MKKKVRMADIAEQLSVSVVTVSKALNDKSGVSEEVRTAIKKLAEEMGYQSSPASSITTGTIGVIMPERFGDLSQRWQSLYVRLFHILHKEIASYGYYVLWETLSSEDEQKQVLPRFCSESRVDGIILIGQPSDNYIQSIVNTGIPVTFLDFYNNKFAVDSIITDNFFSSCELTNYLIDKGHKKIAFVGDIHFSSSVQDRYWGFRKALFQRNIPFHEDYVIRDRDLSNFEILPDFEIPADMPTAFVCSSDYIAYSFMDFLKQKGHRIPEDVSLVGFDNDIYATLTDPKLTTMEIDLSKMAQLATSAIIEKIKDPSRVAERLVVAPKIVYGDSVCDVNPANF